MGRANAQAHRHIANAIAVHGEVGCACTGDHLEAFFFNVQQHLGADGFNLGHDQIGLVFGNGGAQGRFVQHAEHFTFIGHLHGGCAGITVTGNDMAAQTFGTDDEFFAQFA